MKIIKAGSRPTTKASTKYFTGSVWQDLLLSQMSQESTSFESYFRAGARTAWHTHPLGQTLLVVNGIGLIGLRNRRPQLIKTGDTIWIPPDEEHWHGASPENSNGSYCNPRSAKQ